MRTFRGKHPSQRSLTPVQWIYLLVHALVFLVGVALYQLGGIFAVSVGTSLSAAGIAGWVIFLWIQINEDSAQTLKAINTAGIVDIFPTARSVTIRHEYEIRLNEARRDIKFMGFGLRALREDFGDQFQSWCQRAKVRILLVDPRAPHDEASYADQRDIEENNPEGSIRSDVRAFLNYTSQMRADYPNSFQVRLYRCLPSINVCIIDDDAFWGPYVVGQQSRNMLTFSCRSGGYMYNMLSEHFDRIWNNPQLSVPPEQDP